VVIGHVANCLSGAAPWVVKIRSQESIKEFFCRARIAIICAEFR
jgi:hypothetical protein